MILTSQNLQEILDLAKESVEKQEDCFSYSIGNYHFFVYCDYIDKQDLWAIEPNSIDEDYVAKPIGSSEYVFHGDYAQLLVGCVDLAERYFKE